MEFQPPTCGRALGFHGSAEKELHQDPDLASQTVQLQRIVFSPGSSPDPGKVEDLSKDQSGGLASPSLADVGTGMWPIKWGGGPLWVQEAEWQELVGRKWPGDVGRETARSSPSLPAPGLHVWKGEKARPWWAWVCQEAPS